MRVPFPLELSIGTDLVHCKRIFDWTAPDRFRGERFLRHFLHPRDLQKLNQRYPWWQSPEGRHEGERRNLSLWLSGRWAAKEAAKKAWGADLLSFNDLVVENSAQTQAPQVICFANHMNLAATTTTRASRVTEQVARATISHDGEYATATVIATPLHPDIVADLERRKAEAERRVSSTPGRPT